MKSSLNFPCRLKLIDHKDFLMLLPGLGSYKVGQATSIQRQHNLEIIQSYHSLSSCPNYGLGVILNSPRSPPYI